jgi:hypothetical protein
VLHAAMPLFSNLDYVEARDLDLLRAFGNAWSMDFDRRFVCLWSAEPLTVGGSTVMPMPPEERRLEHAVFAVKSWMRGSGILLYPGADPGKKPRQLERLVTNLLASALDVDRFLPRAELLRAAGETGCFPLATRLPHEGPMPFHAGLAAALEMAVHQVESVSRHWQLPLHVETPAPLPALTPEVHRVAALARREGLGPLLVPRGAEGGGSLAIAVAPASAQPADVISRTARLLAELPPLRGAEFGWLGHPAVVPPSFIRAAALWGPAPLVGPALAGSALWLDGDPIETPRSPPEWELRSLVRARIVQQLVRRPARADRAPAAFAAELAFEAHSLRPTLAHAFDTGKFRLTFPDVPRRDEGEETRVATLREWIDGRRATLSAELRARRRPEETPP